MSRVLQGAATGDNAMRIAVIGLGMIGSAVLRAVSAQAGIDVVGVGPAEPTDWSTAEGPFASHYDHARITRITDPDPIWATLAQRAIAAYAPLEAQSRIRFHYPTGHLRVGLNAADPSLADAERYGRELGAPVQRLNRAELAERFPELHLPNDTAAVLEGGGSGWINPRALVAAQLAVAAAQGATVIRAAATGLERTVTGVRIQLNTGAQLEADRVVVSADAATAELVGPLGGDAPALVTEAHTTVYAEVAPAVAKELAERPSLILPLPGNPVVTSIYTTPAAIYPDGRAYLKIGGPLVEPHYLATRDAWTPWFRSAGHPPEIAALQAALRELYPDVPLLGWASKPCANTYTRHDRPYVAEVAPGVVVCTGGCGAAAKSSDAIGRLGADLALHGAWRDALPAEAFAV
jgi:sarcosine oxidase